MQVRRAAEALETGGSKLWRELWAEETLSEMSKEQQGGPARLEQAWEGQGTSIGLVGHGEALPSVLSQMEDGSTETTGGDDCGRPNEEVALARASWGRGERWHDML